MRRRYQAQATTNPPISQIALSDVDPPSTIKARTTNQAAPVMSPVIERSFGIAPTEKARRWRLAGLGCKVRDKEDRRPRHHLSEGAKGCRAQDLVHPTWK